MEDQMFSMDRGSEDQLDGEVGRVVPSIQNVCKHVWFLVSDAASCACTR